MASVSATPIGRPAANRVARGASEFFAPPVTIGVAGRAREGPGGILEKGAASLLEEATRRPYARFISPLAYRYLGFCRCESRNGEIARERRRVARSRLRENRVKPV